MRLGVADHLGWAVLVTADDAHRVVDRRRVELVEPGRSAAPVHYDRGRSSLDELATLIATVRASVVRSAAVALDEVEAAVAGPLVSISLRTWPSDLPDDLAVVVRPPYEARVDAIMYRQVLAEVAEARGLAVHLYDARTAEAEAAERLGDRAAAVLRPSLGPPWTRDHRTALAATVLAT